MPSPHDLQRPELDDEADDQEDDERLQHGQALLHDAQVLVDPHRFGPPPLTLTTATAAAAARPPRTAAPRRARSRTPAPTKASGPSGVTSICEHRREPRHEEPVDDRSGEDGERAGAGRRDQEAARRRCPADVADRELRQGGEAEDAAAEEHVLDPARGDTREHAPGLAAGEGGVHDDEEERVDEPPRAGHDVAERRLHEHRAEEAEARTRRRASLDRCAGSRAALPSAGPPAPPRGSRTGPRARRGCRGRDPTPCRRSARGRPRGPSGRSGRAPT